MCLSGVDVGLVFELWANKCILNVYRGIFEFVGLI